MIWIIVRSIWIKRLIIAPKPISYFGSLSWSHVYDNLANSLSRLGWIITLKPRSNAVPVVVEISHFLQPVNVATMPIDFPHFLTMTGWRTWIAPEYVNWCTVRFRYDTGFLSFLSLVTHSHMLVYFRCAISKQRSRLDFKSTSSEIVLRWMPQEIFDQLFSSSGCAVRQQAWANIDPDMGVTRPQCVNAIMLPTESPFSSPFETWTAMTTRNVTAVKRGDRTQIRHQRHPLLLSPWTSYGVSVLFESKNQGILHETPSRAGNSENLIIINGCMFNCFAILLIH